MSKQNKSYSHLSSSKCRYRDQNEKSSNIKEIHNKNLTVNEQLISDIRAKSRVRIIESISGIKSQKFEYEILKRQKAELLDDQPNENNKNMITPKCKKKENINKSTIDGFTEFEQEFDNSEVIQDVHNETDDKQDETHSNINSNNDQTLNSNFKITERKSKKLKVESNFKSQSNSNQFEDNSLTIKQFNESSLQSQQLICSKIILNHQNNDKQLQTIFQIHDFITFLLKYEHQKFNRFIKISTKNNDNAFIEISEKIQIQILSNATETFHQNNLINSKEFINKLKEFNNSLIEIKYPSESFDSIYNNVINLKKMTFFQKKLNIAIFISGVKETDQKFNGDKNINYVKISDSVTSIKSQENNGSFTECTSLKRILIPSSITSIGKCSFNNCTSLTHIIIPNTIDAIDQLVFCGCSSLIQISIPASVNIIKKFAFNGCTSLKQLIIPSSVTMIEDYAFCGCSSLNKIKIPPSVTSIGISSFSRCSSLEEIELSSSLIEIGAASFKGCSSLKEIKIPSSITVIDDYTFNECKSLKKVSIPSSVISIKRYAFSKCLSLKQIEFSNFVTEIGRFCFNECESLIEITLPNSLTNLEDSAFYKCSSLKKIVISSSLSEIPESCFSFCSSLKQINIPPSVSFIRKCAFEKCTSLEKVMVPNSIKQINEFAFEGCLSLMQISIPKLIEKIDKDAFPLNTEVDIK